MSNIVISCHVYIRHFHALISIIFYGAMLRLPIHYHVPMTANSASYDPTSRMTMSALDGTHLAFIINPLPTLPSSRLGHGLRHGLSVNHELPKGPLPLGVRELLHSFDLLFLKWQFTMETQQSQPPFVDSSTENINEVSLFLSVWILNCNQVAVWVTSCCTKCGWFAVILELRPSMLIWSSTIVFQVGNSWMVASLFTKRPDFAKPLGSCRCCNEQHVCTNVGFGGSQQYHRCMSCRNILRRK